MALLAVGCAGASAPEPEPSTEPSADTEEHLGADEQVDNEALTDADTIDEGSEQPDEQVEPDAADQDPAPPFDPTRFTLLTDCSDQGADAPVEVEVIDGVAELPDDELRSVLNVEVVGEPVPGRFVLSLDCWQTGASFSSARSVEVVTMLDDARLQRVELVGVRAGQVSGVELDGEQVLVLLDESGAATVGEAQLRTLRASFDGEDWSVQEDADSRLALQGPGVRILVEQDSPWSWEFVDSCEGRLSAPSDEGWTVVYIGGGGTDPADIDRLAAADGGRMLEPLPEGAVTGARATSEGFDAVGQPALRDAVLIGDDQGRLRSLVAIDGPADQVIDQLLERLVLTDASDETFSRSGPCEPAEYVG